MFVITYKGKEIARGNAVRCAEQLHSVALPKTKIMVACARAMFMGKVRIKGMQVKYIGE